MNKLVYLLFLAIFFLDWDLDVFPRALKWMPEMISVLVAAIVMGRIAAKCPLAVQTKYLVLFAIVFFHLLTGVVANLVEPGTLFAGLRAYLKHLPIFLLPAVYDFSDKDIRKQLYFLLALAMLQLPVALFQRFVQFAHLLQTGDIVGGTLGNSKVLSVLLLCSIAVIFGFYLKGRIRLKRFIFIALLLLIPTTINETAGTFFLLPLAFIVPVFFSDKDKGRTPYIITAGIAGSLFLVIFVGIYNTYYGGRWGGDITSLVTKGLVTKYESRGISEAGTDTQEAKQASVGRLASIVLAVKTLWEKDPVLALTGVGIGNASKSFSSKMQGHYYDKYAHLGITTNTLSQLLWEVGLLGTGLFVSFFYLVYQDARVLVARYDLAAAIAQGWIGVLAVLLVSTVYIKILYPNVLGYLFAYISGYVAAKRPWLAYQEENGLARDS